MKFCTYSILVSTFILLVQAVMGETHVQDDTVKAALVDAPPQIDGLANDDCWQQVTWQPIDQVWINYGESMDSTDFHGQYKVCWNDAANLLYFLVKTVDDVFVDGYVYSSNPSQGGGYPDYDIVEVFIDQDRSGGLHVFDGTGSTGQQWGTNAENAFSYHIAVDLLPDSQTVTQKVVCDIAGKSWGDYFIANYADHLPQLAMTHTDLEYIWEFSLMVYDDSYQASNPEAARVDLQPGDVMGLSLAYCDNDDPDEDPKKRDNFIGSVWVPAEAYNDHWMNADGFGVIRLEGTPTGIEMGINNDANGMDVYPNPSPGMIRISLPGNPAQTMTLKIYNVLGQQVLEQTLNPAANNARDIIWLNHLPNGLYILRAAMDGKILTKKFTLFR